MHYAIIYVLFVIVIIAAFFVIKFTREERKIQKEEQEKIKIVTVLEKAGIDLNKESIESALQKAGHDEMLIDEIRKHILEKMAKANKTGDSKTVRECNEELKLFSKYVN